MTPVFDYFCRSEEQIMFDNLSLKLDKAFKTLKGQGRITEINVATTVKEIRRALVDADVNYKVANGKEGSVTVVLTKGDETLRRVPVRLPAGGVHDLSM